MLTFAEEFRHHRNWEVKRVIWQAVYPVLKLKHVPTNMECDLCFTSGYGVEYSKYLKYLFDLQPKARMFAQFVFSSFRLKHIVFKNKNMMYVLIIFFLQQHDLLPSTKDVQQYCQEQKIEG